SDWLGLSYEYEQIPEDVINLAELETSMLNMNMNSGEGEEQQRRRDEIDIDDDENVFISTMKKSQTTKSKSTKEQTLLTNDDNEEQWRVVKKKPYDRRRLIKYIIQTPTTLNDQTVQLINTDLWLLQMTQRYDLYRYWLLKYQQYLQ
ncbi:unnamed protein product, partial [Rotaria sp. Silwood2]